MKFRDRLLSLNRLIEQEQGRPISVKEYTYCHYELDQKNLNHVQMDFSRLHKMGLVHRHKEKVDGRQIFVYSLTLKGHRYLEWSRNHPHPRGSKSDVSSAGKSQFDIVFEETQKEYQRWCDSYMALQQEQQKRREEEKKIRIIGEGVVRMTDREYNRFKIAKSLIAIGIEDEDSANQLAIYFSSESWLHVGILPGGNLESRGNMV